VGQESAREPGVGSLDAPMWSLTRAKALALTIRLRAGWWGGRAEMGERQGCRGGWQG
jgi:hypothetical protein